MTLEKKNQPTLCQDKDKEQGTAGRFVDLRCWQPTMGKLSFHGALHAVDREAAASISNFPPAPAPVTESQELETIARSWGLNFTSKQ